jgi:hypothetical protein
LNVDEVWKYFESYLDLDQYREYEEFKVGRYWSDLRWEVPADGTSWGKLQIPPGRGPVLFLGLSMRPTDRYETCGLVLLETGDGRYERAGLFEVGRDGLSSNQTHPQLVAMSRWGEDYQIRTITIC